MLVRRSFSQTRLSFLSSHSCKKTTLYRTVANGVSAPYTYTHSQTQKPSSSPQFQSQSQALSQSRFSLLKNTVGLIKRAPNLQTALEIYYSAHYKDAALLTCVVQWCRREHPPTAIRLWQEIKKSHIKPDQFLINSFIATMGDCRSVEALDAALTAFSTTDASYNSTDTMLTLSEAARKCGQPKRALQVITPSFPSAIKKIDVQTNSKSIRILSGSLATASFEAAYIPTALELLKLANEGYASFFEPTAFAQLMKTFCAEGNLSQGLEILQLMKRHRVGISLGHYHVLLKSCLTLNPRLGVSVHSNLIESALVPDKPITIALLRLYALLQDMKQMEKVFKQACALNMADVYVCTEVIKGYVSVGDFQKAKSFVVNIMPSLGIVADAHVFSTLLSAAAKQRSLAITKDVHSMLPQTLLDSSFIVTGLLHAYIQAGDLETALKVVQESKVPLDTYAWTVLIGSCSTEGFGTLALQIFDRMLQAGRQPDAITCLSLIKACAYSGMVEEAQRVFDSMEPTLHIKPDDHHFAALVSAYARAGYVTEAKRIVLSMPVPSSAAWLALITSARSKQDAELAEYAVAEIEKLNPQSSTDHSNLVAAHVILCNIYQQVGRAADAKRLRMKLIARGLLTVPGVSTIEISGTPHSFKSAEVDHPDIVEINKFNEALHGELSLLHGYSTEMLPSANLELEGEKLKSFHSERLAIAYGLRKMSASETIRITKNARICADCHHFAKLVSKHAKRPILIADSGHLHSFSNGECSCGDHL